LLIVSSAPTQGRLNSIIDHRAKQCTGAHTFTITSRNKTVNVDKHYLNLLYWYFQQNLWLNIKKHAVHNIHRLAWGSYARGAPGQLPSIPNALRQHCINMKSYLGVLPLNMGTSRKERMGKWYVNRKWIPTLLDKK
jgi:hypothetical protein